MRIGAFKQLVNRVTNAQGIIVDQEQKYQGQVITVKNLNDIADVLSVLFQYELVPLPSKEVLDLLSTFKNTDNYDITSSDFLALTNAINVVNSQLPQIMKTISAFSKVQNEHCINIKLPNNLTTLENINIYNERLINIFKMCNIGGNFNFIGFDSGSEWYTFLIDSEPLFKYFIGAVGLAYWYLNFKEKIYNSEIAKLTYKALKSKDKDNKLTENKYAEEVAEIKLMEEVVNMVRKFGSPNNQTEGELIAIVLQSTKSLIKEIKAGSEFHLSLNPPKYLIENQKGTCLNIDYKNIPKIEKGQLNIKQLPDGKTPIKKK